MMKSSPFIYRGADAESQVSSAWVGGKGLHLRQLGGDTPPFFLLSVKAFLAALREAPRRENREAPRRENIDGQLVAAAELGENALRRTAAEIREAVESLPLPETLRRELRPALQALGARWLAVRSSAADEDAADESFAGMHDSLLFVKNEPAQVEHAVKRVWASAFNDRALAYRRDRGRPLEGIAMAVVVQQMVDAHASGVMFTCNPATDDVHQIVVSALPGAGEGLVSAGLPADTYTVEKDTLDFSAQIEEKPRQLVLDPENGGLKDIDTPKDRIHVTTLSDEQVRQVAAAGLRLERQFGRPQDVEFCYDEAGSLYLLQSRPVTGIDQYGPAAGNRLVWDNSNIIESYAGVTSPMTFSFIRRAYTIVYHCFAEVMGISPQVVKENRHTFENMLGLIRGRVYYNLPNWYRLIRLFPGFQYNARFMESMMGLKEPLADDDACPPPGRLRRWFIELPKLLRLLARSSWNFFRIRSRVSRFEENFRRHYQAWDRLDFTALPPHELMGLYYGMEDALLWDWKAPIINDFYVMIFFGALKNLCEKWRLDPGGSLQNDLMCGEGGVESAEPAKMLLRLASDAQHEPALRELILHEPLESLPLRIGEDERFGRFNATFAKYLDLYGFRCVNELKLEEFSLRDRPHLVYQILRNYLALNDPTALDVDAMHEREQRVRREAEARAEEGLRKSRGLFPKKLIFHWVLRCARLGVKNRENMRFARTRIYGLLRELIRALGGRLHSEGLLDDREHVFYLRLDELWDFIKGTAESTDLRGLARLRRAEFQRYREQTSPDDRFETFGMAYHRNEFQNRRPQETAADADGVLRGIGCCPGQVTGRVKVLRDPGEGADLSRDILVAERTDPGWVPLYPAVSGLLIERGSPLSHSAVVAREMGIPTIVGITGLLKTLQTGDEVRMDGSAGTIELLES